MTMDDLETNEGVIFCSPTYQVYFPLRGMRLTAATGKLPCLMPKIPHFSWRRLGPSAHLTQIHAAPPWPR